MLYKRGNYWWMRFTECGVYVHRTTRIRASSKDSRAEAQRVETLAREEIRRIQLFGERPRYKFPQASRKYFEWKKNKKSLPDDANRITQLIPYFQDEYLHEINNQNPNLIRFLSDKKDLAPKTRNHYRQILKTMVKLAHEEWVDESTGKTWLEAIPTPIIKLEKIGFHDKKQPYPLSWNQQTALLNLLPEHYKALALFAVNTGAREQEYCKLSWADEDNGVFWVTATKNGRPRPLVLNTVSMAVIEGQRGLDKHWVFPHRGRPLHRLNNRAWANAWGSAGLPVSDNILKGPHNLRHTFSTRLANLGVHMKVKDWLMGHADQTVGDIYTIPMIESMREAVEMLCSNEVRVMRPLRVVRK